MTGFFTVHMLKAAKCTDPDCNDPACEELILSPKCHSGAPVFVAWNHRLECLILTCCECEKELCKINVV